MDVELMKFRLKQRVLGSRVPDEPWFDSRETTEWFLERLAGSSRYLEFGTGGSTYTAAKLGVSFVAVDSDRRFLKAVEKKIKRGGHARPHGQVFRYADIGPTGLWGRPVGEVSPRRLAQFRAYSDPPPECFDGGTVPDLVLVDGRFRVACALKALRMLYQQQVDWRVLVDDYRERPSYQLIADFASLERSVGRMAVFASSSDLDLEKLDEVIREYETISD